MPSTSKRQRNFMAAVAHNPSFAKKVGVPQPVGKDFNDADKGKFSKGGNTMATQMDPRMAAMMMAKKRAAMGGAPAMAPRMAPGMKKGGMAGGGMHKMPDGKMMKNSAMNMGGMTKMAGGGMPMVMKDGKKIPAFAADGKGAMKHGGSVKKMNMGGMAYAKGGSASSRADGIVTKGKTKGTMIKMNKGGKAC
jgi:hypothetical protein